MVDSSAAMSDPSGATSTTRALAPLSCGKRCSNASSALCACVPGISKVDCREPPSAVESVPAPTATTSQAAITHQRKRATNRPSRYRYVDTVCHPPGHPRPCESLPRSEEHTSELQSLMRISYAV